MLYSTTVGVDLAKNVIQISVVNGRGNELSNRSLSRKKFAEFLGKQKPSLVAFESCATAHHWARAAERHGHEARIIPAKAVAPFRQGHKTDSNDALAVAEAARRPNIKEAPIKTVEQQGLQAILRARDRLIQECIAQSNHMRGILLEFGIAIPQGFAALLRTLPEILEDGDNELPDFYRPTLHPHVSTHARAARRHRRDDKGSRATGEGPSGLQPAHRYRGHRSDRSNVALRHAWLRRCVQQGPRGLCVRRPHAEAAQQRRQSQHRWLEELIERAGPRRAAVALANKNVRTAWALIARGTDYQRRAQLEMAA